MKKTLIPLLLLIASPSFSQESKKFFNWQWKECEPELARFMSTFKPTDSGVLRKDFYLGTRKLQMIGLYSDEHAKIKNGEFNFYYSSGRIEKRGRYVADKRQGLWLEYHQNGMMEDSTVYENDGAIGTSKAWHSNGFVRDSIVVDKDGATAVYWYDNGVVSATGHYVKHKKTGLWQYFHKNGKKAAVETYETDKLVSSQYFNENGEEGKSVNDRDAEFKGGSSAWRKFLRKNIEFPEQYKLKNSNEVTVMISAVIDEDGNVTNVFVDIPFDSRFDDIAVKIMKKSPPWVPSISHNRRVKFFVRQPITFVQEEGGD